MIESAVVGRLIMDAIGPHVAPIAGAVISMCAVLIVYSTIRNLMR